MIQDGKILDRAGLKYSPQKDAGYRALPVSDLPNVDYPTINVFANVPGANPDTMAAAVPLGALRAP